MHAALHCFLDVRCGSPSNCREDMLPGRWLGSAPQPAQSGLLRPQRLAPPCDWRFQGRLTGALGVWLSMPEHLHDTCVCQGTHTLFTTVFDVACCLTYMARAACLI